MQPQPPKFIEIDFADLELRLMNMGKAFALAAPRLAMLRPNAYAALAMIPKPEPAKRPKHHSHLIEAENRKTRRPRR
jgi:hypothetical protein